MRDWYLAQNPTHVHVGGGTDAVTGRKVPEEYLRSQTGGRSGGSYADLTFEAPDGTRIRLNTVDVERGGIPSEREASNVVRIYQQTGEPIILIPKPTVDES